MTNSTLEKVARAICCPDAWCRDEVWESRAISSKRTHMKQARAALQSLRQVDDETVEAMAIALSLADPDERGLPEGEEMAPFYRKLASAAAKAQFDHILTEGGEG